MTKRDLAMLPVLVLWGITVVLVLAGIGGK